MSKGTYVRAIARDLGSSLGTVAHLGALRRTASGAASLDAAHTLEELAAAADIRSHFADPLPLLGMPTIHADAAMAARVAVGATISPDAAVCGADESPTHYAVVSERSLLGIYHAEGEDGALRAEVVLSTGVSR